MKRINQLESGLTEITQNSNLRKSKYLIVSTPPPPPKKRQKKGSELLRPVKTGWIVAHENLHVSFMTIEKQTVHCLQLEFEKLLGIWGRKNCSLRTFWASNICRTGRWLRSFSQSTWQDISASLKLATSRVSDVALDLCLFTPVLLSAFSAATLSTLLFTLRALRSTAAKNLFSFSFSKSSRKHSSNSNNS